MSKIKIGIVGYGNLGKGVEMAIAQNPDMELVTVFTRREPKSLNIITEGVPVCSIESAYQYKNEIDVMILCGGSATDLPEQGPKFASIFNTIDSFDTHAKIPQYFEAINDTAKKSSKVAIISVGWDPGMFSTLRLFGNCILPQGKDYTFWGKGVSQGHSDAIRRVDGVVDGRQYTIPIDSAIEAVRLGLDPELTTRQKHARECFVVAKEGADKAKIESDIKNMPNYFADYDTQVHFITQEELDREHSGIPHGGFVFRTGKTGKNGETSHIVEYSIKLGSNPEFTSSILVAYARAAYRLSKEKAFGAKTVFDIPPAYLSPKSGAELREELL
ncbi:MAG: diaminopimelate dehydrogenase [Clostridiaceae bacterium]|jgi:diaminopimelate dehydrogenase|nr:diaminopimelate dehydrogenase [Clostridiaceae bacterium]